MKSAARCIALCCSLSGCIPQLEWRQWPAQLPARIDASRYPRAPAVMLDEEVDALLFIEPREEAFWQLKQHRAVQILSEAGFKFADVRIPIRKDGRLKLVRARTIGPDGSVQEVAAESILSDEARVGCGGDFDTVRFKIFRFPDVKVGSVLEYVFITETPRRVPSYMWDGPTHQIPVRRYHAELQISDGIRYSMKLYNLDAAAQVRHRGGMAVLTLDVPEKHWTPEERHEPPWLLTEPFWIYRTQQLQLGTWVKHWAIDWPHAMEPVGKELLVDNDKLFGGVELARPGAGCADKRCVVERAIAEARERAEFTGFEDQWKVRPVKEVLSSGIASDDEKALLLFALLDKAELHPRFAYLTRRLGELVDKTFPTPALLDYLLIYLPAQDGLPATWIDPSCEYCAPGQLPERLAHGEAIVFWVDKHRFGADDYLAEVMPIDGAPPGGDGAVRSYDAKLSGSGDAEVTAVDDRRGADARNEQLHDRAFTADDWRKNAEKFVSNRAATGRLVEGGKLEFDRAVGRTHRTLRFSVPAWATPDGDRLLVPLSLFWSTYDDAYVDERRYRPIYIEEPEMVDERIILHLPAGYAVAELPGPRRSTSPAVDYELEAKADGTTVTARRTLRTRLGRFPTSHYPVIREVVRSFAAARQQVIVLRRAGAAAVGSR